MRWYVVLALALGACGSVAYADEPSGYQCQPGTTNKGVGCTCPAGYASKRADENIAVCAVVVKPSEAATIKAECAKAQGPLLEVFGAKLSADELKKFKPAFGERVVKRCQDDPWGSAVRKCFAAAKNVEAAYDCMEMLAPVHRTGLEADSARLRPLGVTLTKTELELRSPIVFGFAIGTMSDRSKPQLDAVVETLKLNPTLRLEIQSHTDNSGNDNKTLSQNRAESVRAYLMKQGIAGDRLVAKGYGETQPIASNRSAWGRAQNRRIALVVLP